MTNVSVILPVHNAERWLDECLLAISAQSFPSSRLQVSVYNDASNDGSLDILQRWKGKLQDSGIDMLIVSSDEDVGLQRKNSPKGVGYAKNRAVEKSNGQYLCFQDADDVMHKDRVQLQYSTAIQHGNHMLIGCGFHRLPEKSTDRYTNWANNLTVQQLYTQAFTSHGPTLIMPTWFCHRAVFDRVGRFSEQGKGVPEDLHFFQAHLDQGGQLMRVNEDLLMYRYHEDAATFSVSEDTIWQLRVLFLEKHILDKCHEFTIWNAGKQGRKLYRALTNENRNKVVAFCDVDARKIDKGFYCFEDSKDLTGGQFEENLASLNLTEGLDYIQFN